MPLTVELDEQTAAVVQELAAKENRAPAQVIHDALAAYAGQANQQPLPTKRRKLPTGVGKYSSGQPELAQRAREVLRQDVKEGKWP